MYRRMPSRKKSAILTNADLAELLALAAEHAKMHAAKALRRASRTALFWSEEAADVLDKGRSLTELTAVGPYIASLIQRWIEEPPEEIPAPPPIRSDFLTLTRANTALTEEPLWLQLVRGDLQIHTVWSDGEGTIAEMAEAAIERGYEYIAITDHSKGLRIAHGINEHELQQQADEIAALNESIRRSHPAFTVLRSIELNLNPRGEGDMESRALRALDLVVGCFHSSLRTKEDQTARYLAALRNPDIQILGHPRGRVYNYRMGLSADWERVFDVAAELDKAVEIDAYPDRQDLSPDPLK